MNCNTTHYRANSSSVPGDPTLGRLYDADGQPRGPSFAISDEFVPYHVAVNPGGDLVVVGVGSQSSSVPGGVWLRRFTHTGAPVRDAVLVQAPTGRDSSWPDVAMDTHGNAYVVWATEDFDGGQVPLRARGFDANDRPLTAAFELAGPDVASVRTALLPSGQFVSAWNSPSGAYANVISLCVPPVSNCGDGVIHPVCEQCDDGAANSDVAPNACRSNCTLPRCGDGTIDGGEQCDDGNLASCDGCDVHCQLEPGLVCGDGIAAPECGEPCDDGNAIDGDGCAPGCVLERVPGGGQSKRDCSIEWRVNNPANVPRFDKHGAFSAIQQCTDDDARCDFDGGTPGACTFHIGVCANNTDVDDCSPPTRIAGFELRSPSASLAAHNPAAAAVRAAFGPVPGAIVGPSMRDVCTGDLSVTVPLRGKPGAPRAGKLKLRTRASLYDGGSDTDKLTLICLP